MPADDLRGAVAKLMPRAWGDLAELVAFRSVADAKQYPPEECEKAAQWVVDAFADVGLEDMSMSPTPDGSMAVHGHAPGPAGTPTVLLYSHYDVQPPLGEEAWTSPVWELTERDGRWYGRGAADCKGNIVMHLTALQALRSSTTASRAASRSSARARRSRAPAASRSSSRRTRTSCARNDPGSGHGQLRRRGSHADDDAARHDERRRQAERARQRDALGDVRRAGSGPRRRTDPVACFAPRRGGRHGRRRARQPDLERGGLSRRAVPQRRERARRGGADGRGQRRGDALGAAGDRSWDRRAGDRLFLGRAGFCGRAREPAPAAGCHRQAGAGRPGRPPRVACAVERALRDRARGRRRSVRGRAGGPRVRGDEDRDGGGPGALDDRGPGRLDPALQRPRRHLPGRRDHAARRRRAALPDPRPERERRPSEIERIALAEALFLQNYAGA